MPSSPPSLSRRRLPVRGKPLRTRKTSLLLAVAAVFILFLLIKNWVSPETPVASSKVFSFADHRASEIFFPQSLANHKEQIDDTLREQARFQLLQPHFLRALAVVEKHEDMIRQEAHQVDFPPEIALGLALLENGGTETALSPAGAAGIFQLMPDTARGLGLTVSEETDERLNPTKNIAAGLKNLARNQQHFPDVGFAAWAHHSGLGNVGQSLAIFLKDQGETNVPNFVEAAANGTLERAATHWRDGLKKHDADLFTVLQNNAVQNQLLDRLGDETELYPYKVLAAAIIYEQYRALEDTSVFPERIRFLRQGRITLDELLGF